MTNIRLTLFINVDIDTCMTERPTIVAFVSIQGFLDKNMVRKKLLKFFKGNSALIFFLIYNPV